MAQVVYHRFFMQGAAKKAVHKRLETLEYKRLKRSCTSHMVTYLYYNSYHPYKHRYS